MAPVMQLLQKHDVAYEFIYTAQHSETIDELILSFGLKKPDTILYNKAEANTISKFAGWAGRMFGYFFTPSKVFPQKGIVLVHGDTASAAWGAVTARLAGCKVAHIESGLRSFNLFHPFPEELMRLITFQFSNIYFCPDEWTLGNLKNYRGIKINTHGNTLIDAVKKVTGNRVNSPLAKRDTYIVVSIHRYENIYSKRFEENIIPFIQKIKHKVIFVLHPSTRELLEKRKDLKQKLEKSGVIFKPRYAYADFVKLLSNSEFVVTDGGSNQEELSYLGKPTLIMRKATERREGLGANAVLSNYDENIMADFLNNYKKYNKPAAKLENSPSNIIYEYLKGEI
jgi:UDP-N-acetylglucosamine 2-epimerase (non-hydrolysing)